MKAGCMVNVWVGICLDLIPLLGCKENYLKVYLMPLLALGSLLLRST